MATPGAQTSTSTPHNHYFLFLFCLVFLTLVEDSLKPLGTLHRLIRSTQAFHTMWQLMIAFTIATSTIPTAASAVADAVDPIRL